MEIRRVVDGIDLATDAKDWKLCRSYFTDEIYADKPSHLKRTNHRITINGDQAEVFSKGYALNILRRETGTDLWEVWGDYVHTLERTNQKWKCSGLTFIVAYARGNEKVREFVPEQ